MIMRLTCDRCLNYAVMSRKLGFTLLTQPEELLCPRDRIGHSVLPVYNDRHRRIGGPDGGRNKICGGLQSERDVIGRPLQNDILSRRSNCQARWDEKTKYCAIANSSFPSTFGRCRPTRLAATRWFIG